MGMPLGDVIPEGADIKADAADAEEPPAKKSRTRKEPTPSTPDFVLVDGGEPQVRTWFICSENKVNVRKEMDHDSDKVKYLAAGEEFQAEGPYKIVKAPAAKRSLKKFHWLKLVGVDAGYVCTCSSKDANKVVANLKRKQSDQASSEKDKLEYALLIKPDWCKQILEKGKVWEIRGEPCNRRGRFAIGASSTGTLVGEATMVNCLKVGKFNQDTGKLRKWGDKKLFIGRKKNIPKHRIFDLSIVKYPKVYAWVMNDVVRYKTPVPYIHPQGAIKWIKLDETSGSGAAAAEDLEAGYVTSSESASDSSSGSSSSSNDEETANEAKEEVKEEVKEDLRGELKEELKEEVKQEIKEDIKEEVKVENNESAGQDGREDSKPLETPRTEPEPPPPLEAPPSPWPEDVQPEQWRNVTTGSVTVWSRKSNTSSPLGSKGPGDVVSGRPDGDWLKLFGEDGYMMIRNPVASKVLLAMHDPLRRLQHVVSTIKAGLDETALKELLQSLLGPSGDLGDDPVQVLKQTEVALVVAGLRKQNVSESVKALSSQVKQHFKDQFDRAKHI